MYSQRLSRARAFTLVDLLVVVAIIGIIAGFGVPYLISAIKGSQLSQSVSMVKDQISLARQTALTKNQTIELRFYRFGNNLVPGENPDQPTTGQFRAIQTFTIAENGVALPADKVNMLPDTIIVNPGKELSSLIGAESQKAGGDFKKPGPTDPELPRGVKDKYEYVSFRINPDGTTNLKPSEVWFATFHTLQDLQKTASNTKPPPNFVTLQIDPVTSSIKSCRPGLM